MKKLKHATVKNGKRCYVLFLLQILLISSASAQAPKAERLSNFIQKALESFPVIPSVSVSVANGKKALYINSFGYSDVENKVKSKKNTNFYIASTTKSFVGLLAAILASEGEINLNEQITNYSPFKDYFSNNEIFKNITVLDLLTHQSGIDNDYLSFILAYSGEYTEESILKLIEEKTRKNEQGKSFEYSNFGYYMFDAILRAELGLNWKDVLKEKIFIPLGMNNTTAYISEAKDIAFPYNNVFPEKLQKLHLKKTDETMHAAGGLVSNANDIAKFLTFCINDGNFNDEQIYSSNLMQSTFNKQVAADHKGIKVFKGNGYGLGWRLGDFNNDRVIYHFGGYSGYYSHLSFLPEKRLGVSVFINHELGLPLGNLIANYAYDLYLGNESNLKKHEKTLKKKFPKLLKSAQKSQLAHEKKQAKRTWQLSLPKSNYVGQYYNENFGTVRITYHKEKNYVEIGNLKAECTPFPLDDTMRLELIPNSGTIIKFLIEGSKVKGISYAGEVFEKID